MRFPYPSRETTSSEYAVLVVFVAAALIIVGVVALVMGFRAPTEKQEVAVALEHRGFLLLGIGVAIAVAYWLFRRFRDY
jgi:L-asparagine transporter-like permease